MKSTEQPSNFASPACVNCRAWRSSAIRRPSFCCSMGVEYHTRQTMATELNYGLIQTGHVADDASAENGFAESLAVAVVEKSFHAVAMVDPVRQVLAQA